MNKENVINLAMPETNEELLEFVDLDELEMVSAFCACKAGDDVPY